MSTADALTWVMATALMKRLLGFYPTCSSIISTLKKLHLTQKFWAFSPHCVISHNWWLVVRCGAEIKSSPSGGRGSTNQDNKGEFWAGDLWKSITGSRGEVMNTSSPAYIIQAPLHLLTTNLIIVTIIHGCICLLLWQKWPITLTSGLTVGFISSFLPRYWQDLTKIMRPDWYGLIWFGMMKTAKNTNFWTDCPFYFIFLSKLSAGPN